MAFSLPDLPYGKKDLEPFVSERTLDIHHGKHHQAYVDNLNNLVVGTPNETKSLEELIMLTANSPESAGIFNNAAQVWNHTFFWHCMRTNGGRKPNGKVAELIDSAFGSYENFATEFKAAALSQFGSGWAWLVQDGSTLKIVKTPNAGSPMVNSQIALLACDVWEHAYYLDYQNRRADFVQTFLDRLINWKFVNSNLKI